jgi:hypothetical protein
VTARGTRRAGSTFTSGDIARDPQKESIEIASMDKFKGALGSSINIPKADIP